MRLNGRRRTMGWSLFAVFSLLLVALVSVPAQAATTSAFVSFAAFRAGIVRSTAATGVGAVEARQIASYLTGLYRDVDVRTSFTIGGTYFDCATVDSQPTVTALGIRSVARPPSDAVLSPAASARGAAPVSTGIDSSGHTVSCPAGTIPMRRTTPGAVVAAGGVTRFLRAKVAPPTDQTDVPGYRHAYGYDFVSNDGAFTDLNVWNPKVAKSTKGDDHSLSQFWVLGGSGTKTQSAEAGWTKDPIFSTTDPVYFVFFTPDDYTSGCYDLNCVGFVQTDSSIALGGPVSPCCSVPNGTNDAYTQEYILESGKWWYAINGTFVGYYPISVYKGGQLSKHATLVEYGGEVNGSATNVNWPQMGSGAFAKAGADKAAYQDSPEYIGLTGGKAFYPTLTTQVTGEGTKPSPCYSLVYTPPSGTTGGFFYYGGPGGKQGVC